MRLLIMFLAVDSLAAGGPRPPREEWADFLARPTFENYRRIAKTVEGCRSSSCESEARPDSSAVTKLIELVKKGSRHAIELAFLCLTIVDGGDLEDVIHSLGEVADSSPQIFLEEVKKRGLPLRQMRKIVGMMPESVIDDDAKRRDAVRKRIRSLSTVSDQELIDVKHQAIAVLQSILEQS